MSAWDKAIRELTRASVIVENAIDLASEKEVPDILCSALTQDCLGRGKTITEGGAVYDFISGLQVGIADMADSLAAMAQHFSIRGISKVAPIASGMGYIVR